MIEVLANEPVEIFLTIMTVILIAPMLSERVRLPGIVGLILAGMVIGPFGLRILDNGRTIILLADIGLIYLMFSAGLEVDLFQFNRVRRKALVFGLLTFGLPQLLGTALGRGVGLNWPGAILLGSAFASHTLLAFPVVSRLGILSNEALAVTVGATVFTDVAAFLVLAIIAGTEEASVTTAYFIRLIVLMLGYAALVLFGLPRLGKWFFGRFSGRAVEFQFVLVALFVAALLAELIGMHGVVGAFLAGLAINSTLPHRSVVLGRVLFLGEAFFIPLFLMHSGMITDPRAFVSSAQTLVLGLEITAVAYLTKYLAAWIAGRFFHYSRDQVMTMWGLSQAQAAVTLPTIFIGQELGLFDQDIFNAVILMILATSFTSPLLVERYGRKLSGAAETREAASLFSRVLVPIANPKTQEHLITLAGILARTEEGVLLPLNVALSVNGRVEGLDNQKQLLAAEILNDAETTIQPLRRVDTSIAGGILHAALENEASSIVLGWGGRPRFRETIFGSMLDRVVWNAPIPVLVCRMTAPINSMRQVVLVVPLGSLSDDLLGKTFEAVEAIAEAINVPVVVLAAPQYAERLEQEFRRPELETSCHVHAVEGNIVQEATKYANADDLMVVTTIGSRGRFQSSLGQIPEHLAAAAPEASMVVVHYP